jgi:mono/diheme cytochrome c family protein
MKKFMTLILVLSLVIVACQTPANKAYDLAVANENFDNSIQAKTGKSLYETPANCASCHQVNGAGLSPVFPSLKGSPWVTGDPVRLIKIVLKGLQGPILVNGKNFNSVMPPQTNIPDADLAKILTYVRSSWGNKASAISEKDIKKVRKTLKDKPLSVKKLLKDHPFEADDKKNGHYVDLSIEVIESKTKPVVVRTFMPDVSPSAFAISLPEGHYYCWDAEECHLAYVWSKGGFITNSQKHWASNGKPTINYNGAPYYKINKKGVDTSKHRNLSKNDGSSESEPGYWRKDNRNFPIRIGKDDNLELRFKGYRLVKGIPEFMYSFGPYEIREMITANKNKDGIKQSFKIDCDKEVTLRFNIPKIPPSLGVKAKCKITPSVGKIVGGKLKLTAAQAKSFSIDYRELSENVKKKKVWLDPARAASEYPDFNIQGEYTITTGSRREKNQKTDGVQVAAMGQDTFYVSFYTGGLPGTQKKYEAPVSKVMNRAETLKTIEKARKVTRTSRSLNQKAPAGAVVIFAGAKTENYSHGEVYDGALWPTIKTKDEFQDFKLHVEFRLPFKPFVPLSSQGRGNSGLYLQNRFEVQVLDSFALDYADKALKVKYHSSPSSWCGSVYGQKIPDLNMCYPPLQWQTYDIDFKAAVLDSKGKVKKPASMSVKFNGVTIHKNVILKKTTTAAGQKSAAGTKGIMYLQDHGNPVAYRNFWILDTTKKK